MSNTVRLTLTNCADCPNHSVEADPDPHDSFCYDDVKVVCSLAKRNVTVACRPYRVRKESEPIPKWCPLRKQENKTVCPACSSEKIDPCGRGGLRCTSCNNRWGAD